MTKIANASAALALALALAAPVAGMAQEAGSAAGEALMALDGSVPDTGITADTGWHTCTVVRTGAGWGNHYLAITCPSGPFTNKWHIMNTAQKDPMLATALSAAASDSQVQVFIQAASGGGYNEILALYLHK